MWLQTTIGFFSIVEKPQDAAAGMLTVRARCRADLEALRAQAMPGLGPVQADAGTDYKYRARASRADVAAAFVKLALSIDYSNFKDAVAARQGPKRAKIYGQVWGALAAVADSAPAPTAAAPTPKPAASGKSKAFGGVLVDADGRYLLRAPTGGYGGYAWTFPKGRQDAPADTGEQVALREVKEETGYDAQVVGELPAAYEGDMTVTRFYLMRPVGAPGAFDAETAEVRWATYEEARKLIGLTPNAKGRARDLQILEDAHALLDSPVSG